MRRSAVILAFLCCTASLWVAPARADDAFDGFTGVASGFVIQSFFASRHFMEESETDGGIHRIRESQDLRPPIDRPTKFRWNLGYTFTRAAFEVVPGLPDHVDYTHHGLGGFGWDATDDVDLGVDLLLESSPQSNYRGGSTEIHVSYLLPLKRRPPPPSDDDFDTPEYKKKKKRPTYLDEEGASRKATDDEPHLLIRAKLVYSVAVREASAQKAGEEQVDATTWAGEFIYAPDSTLNLRLSLGYTSWDTPIDTLLANTGSRRKLVRLPSLVPSVGLVSFVQGFSAFFAEFGGSSYFREHWQLDAGVSYSSYAPTSAKITYGANGALHRTFSEKWRVGGGLDFSYAPGQLTTLVSAGVSYSL